MASTSKQPEDYETQMGVQVTLMVTSRDTAVSCIALGLSQTTLSTGSPTHFLAV